MKNLREYIINFGNLKIGTHRYDFEIGEDFFEHFEYSLVKHGKIDVILLIEKQKETLMDFHFTLEGYIRLACDRCLDEYDYPVNREERLIVKLEGKPQESNEEIVFLPVDAYEMDVSPFIYEYINISLPLKSSCELVGKECNPAMLEYLQKVNTQNKADESSDPRWEGLRNLNNDNSN